MSSFIGFDVLATLAFTLSLLKCAVSCLLFSLFWYISIIIMSHPANQHLSWQWDISKLCMRVCVCVSDSTCVLQYTMFHSVWHQFSVQYISVLRYRKWLRLVYVSNVQLRCVQFVTTCHYYNICFVHFWWLTTGCRFNVVSFALGTNCVMLSCCFSGRSVLYTAIHVSY